MKNLFPLILYLCCSFYASAQDQACNPADNMKVKGKWTTTADNIVFPDKTFPAAQYSQLRTRLDKIAVLFQQAYPQPMGIEAKWYRSIRGGSPVENGPVPYQFNSLYQSWYCNQNLHKMMLGSETGTWAYVFVNDLHWFLNDQYDQLSIKINGAIAYKLPKTKEQWKGFAVYETSGSGNKSKSILLTQNNQVPYMPVTRLQYLKAVKEKLETEKKSQIDAENKMPERTEAEQEASKQRGLEATLKYASANKVEERKATYLKNYKTDRQLKEETVQRTQKYFDGLIKGIDDSWNSLTEEGLKEPAIVDNISYSSLFKGFTTLEKGGNMIVLPNPGYFNMKLPRYVPQVIMLFWEWDSNPAAQDFKKHIDEDFPIDQLKALLGK